MNTALLSIGTNEDMEANLAFCHKLLDDNFNDITYSDTSFTVPYGAHYKNNFLNQLALIYTDKDLNKISLLLKSFEKQIGRTSSDKEKGIVKIDIDIVSWNDEIIKPNDFGRSYITDLLPSLKRKSL